MNIKPIKSQRDYKKALKQVEKLFDAKPNTSEGDKLDILVTLIEAWEAKHFPIDPPNPIDAIIFAMEQKDISRKDLEPYIGSRARVSEVFNNKRNLTLPMIRSLNQHLGIPADILIRPQPYI